MTSNISRRSLPSCIMCDKKKHNLVVIPCGHNVCTTCGESGLNACPKCDRVIANGTYQSCKYFQQINSEDKNTPEFIRVGTKYLFSRRRRARRDYDDNEKVNLVPSLCVPCETLWAFLFGILIFFFIFKASSGYWFVFWMVVITFVKGAVAFSRPDEPKWTEISGFELSWRIYVTLNFFLYYAFSMNDINESKYLLASEFIVRFGRMISPFFIEKNKI